MDETNTCDQGPDEVELVQEAAVVAVSWVLGGRLAHRQSDLLEIGYQSGHDVLGAAVWVMRGERALRDMRNHLHHVVEMDGWFRTQDWPGCHEVLRRIVDAGAPEAQEATGPAGAAL
ncbi:hypothetical protein ABT224_10905 [Streptomyces sp. NPDC001584]|uniref:hypothetical protein n=1 Tax=Streptomyces sp. NPDC001584 TaxID=3154521 RepID=UPI00331E41D4